MKPYLTLHHPASAQRYYSERMWREDTFYSLLTSHATERPDAVALQDARQTLTWGELKRWTDGVAADLREYGLVGSDRVMMWLSNRLGPQDLHMRRGRRPSQHAVGAGASD